MTNTISFTKMHGAGNDYIYVNTLLYNVEDPVEAARSWSMSHTGIGSDGLVLIGAPTAEVFKHSDRSLLEQVAEGDLLEADFSMRIFNADGSEAMMCGNASRCIGKYLYEKGLTDKTEIRLLTLSGVKVLRLSVKDGQVERVTVDMLEPALNNHGQCGPETLTGGRVVPLTLEAEGKSFCGTFVSMGNPHFVVFVDDAEHIDVEKYGSSLECNPVFPERCNIEFAQLLPADGKDNEEARIRMRVWERGSGITMACGTGACATAVAAAATGRAGRKSAVRMDGGELHIDWSETDNHVYMAGPAAFVFEGTIPLPESHS